MKDEAARRAFVALLARGAITLPEAMTLAGISRQLAHYWAREIDWKRMRRKRIAELWRKEIAR